MNELELITVRQASEILGKTVQHVRLLVRTGRLKGYKLGRDWLMDKNSITDLKKNKSKVVGNSGQKLSAIAINETKEGYFPGGPALRLAKLNKTKKVTGFTTENNLHLSTIINDEQLSMGMEEEKIILPLTDRVAPKAFIDPRNRLNDLTATEWLPETVSVWVQKGLGASHPDAQIERQHPAPFSFSDIARLIRFFTKRNEVVLDPFVSIGSTLKACALHERLGIGIELNPRYVKLTRERLVRELPNNDIYGKNQKVLEGDIRDLLPQIFDNSVDFIVTSPPYGNILHKEDHKARRERIANGLDTHYSEDPRDLGNIQDYEIFLAEVSRILGSCGRVLKSKKYMAIVVSDFRHGPKYVMFHADLARCLETYNFRLRGMTVLYQRHKRVYPYGYPFSFVPNIHNQIILVMQNEK